MKQVVLIENDINTRPFSTQVLACLPPLPWTLSPEDLANPNRQDLRQVRVFSVDPPGNLIRISAIFWYFMYLGQTLRQLYFNCFIGCRDIDDALHCTLLPNGNFEVGVRILEQFLLQILLFSSNLQANFSCFLSW